MRPEEVECVLLYVDFCFAFIIIGWVALILIMTFIV